MIEPVMLRVPVILGLIATVGCRQPAPPPAAVELRPLPATVRAEVVQARSPAGDDAQRGAVRGRPITWCAGPRPNDPLLLDALELGTITDNDGSALDDLRAIHHIPLTPADQIAFVSDEAGCEKAARAYDATISIYRSSGRPEHIEPVHVVALGPLYLVESAGDRRLGYEVKFFDRGWRHRRGGFGVEF